MLPLLTAIGLSSIAPVHCFFDPYRLHWEHSTESSAYNLTHCMWSLCGDDGGLCFGHFHSELFRLSFVPWSLVMGSLVMSEICPVCVCVIRSIAEFWLEEMELTDHQRESLVKGMREAGGISQLQKGYCNSVSLYAVGFLVNERSTSDMASFHVINHWTYYSLNCLDCCPSVKHAITDHLECCLGSWNFHGRWHTIL